MTVLIFLEYTPTQILGNWCIIGKFNPFMNKAYLLVICVLAASFTGCLSDDTSDLEEQQNTEEAQRQRLFVLPRKARVCVCLDACDGGGLDMVSTLHKTHTKHTQTSHTLLTT